LGGEQSGDRVRLPKKVYGQWAGNPNGFPEDTAQCVAEVPSYSGWYTVQCSRKRGFGSNGGYCKQHAKTKEAVSV